MQYVYLALSNFKIIVFLTLPHASTSSLYCILTPGSRFAVDGGDVACLIIQPVPRVVRPVGYVIDQHCNGAERDSNRTTNLCVF